MGKLVKISATLVAMVFLIALVGCDEPTDTPKAAHNHVWSDWKHDTTKHWKECSCGTKTEEGNHAFENNKCKTCGYDKTIAVESITLNKTTLSIAEGGTEKLSVVVKPDNASSKTVTWESSNKAVATVGTDGTVRAVVKGEATITAKAGDQKAECAVTVTEPTPAQPAHTHKFEGSWENNPEKHWKECTAEGCDNPKAISEEGAHTYNEASETPNNCTVCNYVRTVAVKSVTLDSITLSFKVGETKKLTATIAPANATNKTVTWESSNEGIAKVDQSGNVEAMGEGDAIITAKAGDQKAECPVTVTNASQPDPEHQHNCDAEIWSNDDSNHWNQCTAEECTELGGKVNLAPHDWDNDNNKCTVCQKEKPVVPITGVVIDNEDPTIRIEIDGTVILTAHVEPAEANQAITWSSDKKDVASVSGNGVVTGHKGGTATITAKAAGDETKTVNRIIKVSCATHNYGSYIDNENGTHSAICEVCGKELEAEAHQFGDDDVCGCGAHKPLSKFSVIKGKNGDIESMTNTLSALEAYKKNLEKYSFDTAEIDNEWQVTCNVEVSALKTATDGGAIGFKNIVAILEFDELKTFTIGNITRDGETVFGSNDSWVSDAHLFVEGADDNKTYVTLWMSMEPGDDGNIPDRTYEIRAYAGDTSPKTLTFKFIDKPSEVSSFEELKTAVGNDYANIKLTSDITVSETIRIAKTVTIDLNGCTLTMTSSKYIFAGVDEVETKANVTIKDSLNDGKIISGSWGLAARYGGTLTLENIALTGEANAAENSTLIIKGSQITGCTNYAVIAQDSSTVNIIDSIINGHKNGEDVDEPAICVGNGLNHDNDVTVTINNSKVDGGDNSAIYKPQKGSLTIEGISVITGGNGVSLKAGSLVVKSGSKIKATGEYIENPDNNSNGINESGAAIAIAENNAYAGNVTIDIESGAKVESANGNAIKYFRDGNAYTGDKKAPVITCNEGDLKSAEGKDKVAVPSDKEAVKTDNGYEIRDKSAND